MDKKAVEEKSLLFSIGAVSYGLIEVVWRGRTHPSMLLAGGICFCGMDLINRKLKNAHPIYKCVLSSGLITSVELVFGCIFNIILKQNVWDYRNIPFNLFGQVCLLYSVLWGLLSIIAVPLSGKLGDILRLKLGI